MRRFSAPKPQKKKRRNYGSVTLMMEEESDGHSSSSLPLDLDRDETDGDEDKGLLRQKKTNPPKQPPCDRPITRSAAVPADDIIDGDSQLGDGM